MATPDIEAGDCTNSGNNTASTSWAISCPAQSTGDLIIVNLVSDALVTHGTLPNGRNGETPVTIQRDNQTGLECGVSCWYWIATGVVAAGTITVTPSASEQWTATVVRVPLGEFLNATPIDSSANGGSLNPVDTNVPSATWTATSGAALGRVVAWLGVDADPITGTPGGWTDAASVDRGAVSGTLSQRTAAATASETVASANWTIAGDSSSTIGYIINASADNPQPLPIMAPMMPA